MIFKSKLFYKSLLFSVLFTNLIIAQEELLTEVKSELSDEEKQFRKLNFYNYRGTNVFDLGLGVSTIFGDYKDSNFGFYYRAGYKRSISPSLYIGVTANGYNLAFTETEESSEMDLSLLSVDFNLEYLFIPTEYFSPFIYGGLGLNMNTDSENDTNTMKAQVGFGFEVLIVDKVAFKVFYEYNYSFDDEMEILIGDASNDKFMRIGIGVNFYFGGEQQKQKVQKNVKTIMNSNPIIPNN